MQTGDAETLRYLVNPVYHDKLDAGQADETEPKEDRRRRYRHRINALHKEMMKGGSPEPGLKAAHDAFVAAAVKHARFEETREAVENDLRGVGIPSAPKVRPTQVPALDIQAADTRGFSRPPAARTLDQFVTRKSSAKPPHVPRRRRPVSNRKKSKQTVDDPSPEPKESPAAVKK